MDSRDTFPIRIIHPSKFISTQNSSPRFSQKGHSWPYFGTQWQWEEIDGCKTLQTQAINTGTCWRKVKSPHLPSPPFLCNALSRSKEEFWAVLTWAAWAAAGAAGGRSPQNPAAESSLQFSLNQTGEQPDISAKPLPGEPHCCQHPWENPPALQWEFPA